LNKSYNNFNYSNFSIQSRKKIKVKIPIAAELRGIRLHESIGIFTLENGSQQSCGVSDPFSLNEKA